MCWTLDTLTYGREAMGPWRVNFPGFCPRIRITFGRICESEDGFEAKDLLDIRNMNKLFSHRLRRTGSPGKGGGSSTVALALSAHVDVPWLGLGRSRGRRSLSVTDDIDTMTDLNLQEILEFAISVAQDAGGMILQASRSRLSTTSSTMSEKMNCIPQCSVCLTRSCGFGDGDG